MNAIVAALLTSIPTVSAQPGEPLLFVRQSHPATGVIWDMPPAASGVACRLPAPRHDNILLEWWNIDPTTAATRLCDQKLIGAYLPTAEIKITTYDPYIKCHRSRIDQPFIIEISVDGLLTGLDFPFSAANVLLERHLQSYRRGMTTLDPARVVSNKPVSRAYLGANGKHVLRFEASALTAADPTKAAGEEHFVVRLLSDSSGTPTQIASGIVQIWPIASGSIQGIAPNDVLRFQAPPITLLLHDLYPRSDTYLLLFEGTQITGMEGTVVATLPINSETAQSQTVTVNDLDSYLTQNGTYSLALVSDTAFGRDLLSSVTFSCRRSAKPATMLAGCDPTP